MDLLWLITSNKSFGMQIVLVIMCSFYIGRMFHTLNTKRKRENPANFIGTSKLINFNWTLLVLKDTVHSYDPDFEKVKTLIYFNIILNSDKLTLQNFQSEIVRICFYFTL